MRGALATWDPGGRSLVREEIVIDTRGPVEDSKNDPRAVSPANLAANKISLATKSIRRRHHL